MRVIIFNDAQNFNGSLNFINEKFDKKDKKFWDYNKYIPFLLEKTKSLKGFGKEKLELVKTYFYEGRYSSDLLSSLKWNINQKIKEINILIEKERKLLEIISQEKLSNNLREKVNLHVNSIKYELEREKEIYLRALDKQLRNFEGQKRMIEDLEGNTLIDLKMTLLKQKGGEIYQKGVDVLLATDLVNLAHTNSYDLAIVLSGDTDLIEAVKLVKSLGKTVVVFSYFTPKKPQMSNISSLMNFAKFINLRDLTEKEIEQMSETRKK
jgi:uncharacterized LabA/DUF88 family protein